MSSSFVMEVNSALMFFNTLILVERFWNVWCISILFSNVPLNWFLLQKLKKSDLLKCLVYFYIFSCFIFSNILLNCYLLNCSSFLLRYLQSSVINSSISRLNLPFSFIYFNYWCLQNCYTRLKKDIEKISIFWS